MKKVSATILLLLILAGIAQALAAVAIARARGSATAYAYQSPDADEYVAYARGLAWHAQFTRVDHDGRQLAMWPDTWRTPGYPIVLAIWMLVFGDGTAGLLVFHQILTALTVPLVWLILRRYCSPRWALVGALAWCLDPFRIYYSLWLLAETLFTLVLLLGVYAWSVFSERGWTIPRAVIIGLITGTLVLTRPIGLPLPVLACLGLLLAKARPRTDAGVTSPFSGAACGTDPVARDGAKQARLTAPPDCPLVRDRRPRRLALMPRLALTLACAVGAGLAIAPWSLRNRIEAGHWGLTGQAGASLAYHKVADVMLWSQGCSAYRFNADALAQAREEIDRRLLIKWEQVYGPASLARRSELHWQKLNFGQTGVVDPFAASKLLQKVGVEVLLENKRAAAECFATQGLSMLVFPLGLALWPPVGTGPLSLLGGGSPLARVAAIALGLLYAALFLAVIIRLVLAVVQFINSRTWPAAMFAFWPALALFALSVPSEDPRFRLPLIPLMLLIVLCSRLQHSTNGRVLSEES